jgi:hypothetical protein
MDEMIYQVEVSTVLLVDLNPSIAYPGFAESALNFLISGLPYTWYKVVAETRIADAAHARRTNIKFRHFLDCVPVLIARHRL